MSNERKDTGSSFQSNERDLQLSPKNRRDNQTKDYGFHRNNKKLGEVYPDDPNTKTDKRPAGDSNYRGGSRNTSKNKRGQYRGKSNRNKSKRGRSNSRNNRSKDNFSNPNNNKRNQNRNQNYRNNSEKSEKTGKLENKQELPNTNNDELNETSPTTVKLENMPWLDPNVNWNSLDSSSESDELPLDVNADWSEW
eukprot:TRINITY_DN562_c0_g1_i6.p1 TRINITY_DN562_c0_g1~~TRINITY_DN562_c0_g1_i6.p1  ORF type:complete len:194 (-),score=50.21 TRINITY_DN562_c0_g1_i6:79-660(-)